MRLQSMSDLWLIFFRSEWSVRIWERLRCRYRWRCRGPRDLHGFIQRNNERFVDLLRIPFLCVIRRSGDFSRSTGTIKGSYGSRLGNQQDWCYQDFQLVCSLLLWSFLEHVAEFYLSFPELESVSYICLGSDWNVLLIIAVTLISDTMLLMSETFGMMNGIASTTPKSKRYSSKTGIISQSLSPETSIFTSSIFLQKLLF